MTTATWNRTYKEHERKPLAADHDAFLGSTCSKAVDLGCTAPRSIFAFSFRVVKTVFLENGAFVPCPENRWF